MRSSVLLLALLAAPLGASVGLRAGDSSPATVVAPDVDVRAALRRAVFAGGCFWCMESEFEKLDGVVDVVSGYAGGHVANPTYRQVSTGRTGHFEVIEVTYDPARIDYARLLEVYWRNIDPTVDDRQFCDVGPQYRSAIFVATDEERRLAEASRAALAADPRFEGHAIHTEIRPAATFWPAEPEHQDFAKRHAMRYQAYRIGCGRDALLDALWGPRRGD
jgi:peptide-methionine (S)-S-oxide reductase